MKTIQFIILSLLTAMSSIAYAQPFELTDRDVDYSSISAINKENGIVSSRTKSNIKIYFPFESNKSMSDSGNIAVSDKVIYNATDNPLLIELPKIQKYTFNPKFSTQKDLLYYWNYDDVYQESILFYDLSKREIAESHVFDSTPPYDIGYREISRDGSAIALEINSFLNLYNYKEGKFVKSAEFGPRPSFFPLLISKYGNRVFYDTLTLDQNLEIIYIERGGDGWPKEKNLSTPYLSIEGEKIPLELVNIANDGKTILTRTAIWPSEKQYIALIHEIDGKWQEPELIGDYTLPPSEGDYYEAYLEISDDARVIAVQQPRDLSPMISPGDLVVVSYEIFVYVQDKAGHWHKHQVNPPEVGADGFSDILLSPNGEQLYWVPEKTLSGIPWGNQIK